MDTGDFVLNEQKQAQVCFSCFLLNETELRFKQEDDWQLSIKSIDYW